MLPCVPDDTDELPLRKVQAAVFQDVRNHVVLRHGLLPVEDPERLAITVHVIPAGGRVQHDRLIFEFALWEGHGVRVLALPVEAYDLAQEPGAIAVQLQLLTNGHDDVLVPVLAAGLDGAVVVDAVGVVGVHPQAIGLSLPVPGDRRLGVVASGAGDSLQGQGQLPLFRPPVAARQVEERYPARRGIDAPPDQLPLRKRGHLHDVNPRPISKPSALGLRVWSAQVVGR
mmetsp:Transcript_42761/g.118068  ORF Transcript_42761/g.118068 Transcript_42761/m.118068 type:complete len:228 (-) Transcript_42761:656-1339(-)